MFLKGVEFEDGDQYVLHDRNNSDYINGDCFSAATCSRLSGTNLIGLSDSDVSSLSAVSGSMSGSGVGSAGDEIPRWSGAGIHLLRVESQCNPEYCAV